MLISRTIATVTIGPLPIWHNSLIRIDNKPVFSQPWYSKGIRKVADLLKDRNAFLSLHELKDRFDVKTNFLTLLGLSSSLNSLEKDVRTTNVPASLKASLIDSLKPKRPIN